MPANSKYEKSRCDAYQGFFRVHVSNKLINQLR